MTVFDAATAVLSAAALPATVLRPHSESLFVAWNGVLALVYDGFPPPMALAKERLSTLSGMQPEKFGSKWPKTTLGAEMDGSPPLTLAELQTLRELCRTHSAAIAALALSVAVPSISVVEYELSSKEEDEAKSKSAQRLGIQLDADDLGSSRLGGVGASLQVSIVKRSAGSSKTGRGADASADAGGADAGEADGAAPTPAALVVPDSPPGELHPTTMDKYLGYVAAANEGNKINDHIRHSKKFRNPCLLDKLVAFLGVHEFGTVRAAAARLSTVASRAATGRRTQPHR